MIAATARMPTSRQAMRQTRSGALLDRRVECMARSRWFTTSGHKRIRPPLYETIWLSVYRPLLTDATI